MSEEAQFYAYQKKYQKYKKKYHNYVKKLLKKSLNPHQDRDFFFLTIPQGHPDEGKLVPVDYLLKNMVLYFWKHKFVTAGLDQGNSMTSAFITFNLKTLDNNNTIDVLKTLLEEKFGKENIKIYDKHKKNYEDYYPDADALKKDLKQQRMVIEKFIRKFPNSILINYQPNYIAMIFSYYAIPDIHKKLNLKIPSHFDALPGNLIPYAWNK